MFDRRDEPGHEFRVGRQGRQHGGRPLADGPLGPVPLSPGERAGLLRYCATIEFQQAGMTLNAHKRLP
jgi:hypothetical protein